MTTYLRNGWGALCGALGGANQKWTVRADLRIQFGSANKYGPSYSWQTCSGAQTQTFDYYWR